MTRSDTAQLCLGTILFASVVVIAHACTTFDDSSNVGYWIWAFVCSGTSAVTCASTWLFLGPWTKDEVTREKATKCVHLVFLFLTTLWLGGAFVMTFKLPFPSESNGYFANWLALEVSLLASIEFMPKVKEHFEKLVRGGALLVPSLFLASVVVLINTALGCSKEQGGNFPFSDCLHERAWIETCAPASILLCLLLFLPPVTQRLENRFKFVALLFFALWSAGAFVATFVGPYKFPVNSNGYFGSWAAFAASLLLVDGSLGWKLETPEALEKCSQIAGTHGELLVLFSASIITMVAAAINCENMESCMDYNAWAVACPTVSLFLAIGLLLLRLAGKDVSVDGAMQLMAPFLLFWWIGGTGCMTYKKPFVTTGNGYYGAWASLISAALLTERYSPMVRKFFEGSGAGSAIEVSALWFASIVLVTQAAVDKEGNTTVVLPYSSQWIWAIVVSSATVLLCIPIHLRVLVEEGVAVIALILFAAWGAAAGVLTFEYPYVLPGNSYYAIWIGFVASARFFRLNFFQIFARCKAFGASQLPVAKTEPDVPELQEVMPASLAQI